MYYYKNKQLFVTTEDGSEAVQPLYTARNQIFLTADITNSYFSYEEYERALHSPVSKKFIQVFKLNEDETIHSDISHYIASYNITFKYENGKIRSGSLTLMNYKNELFPSPVMDTIWKGTKIYIKTGIYYNGTAYIKNCGIFVMGQPTLDDTSGIISLNIHDKFSLLDGTIGGKRDTAFSIARGTDILTAIKSCLSEDKGNGKPYDLKPVIYDYNVLYCKEDISVNGSIWCNVGEPMKTPYDIMKNPNMSMGELILELALMVNAEVYYDEYGNLNLMPSAVTNDDLISKAVLWNYTDQDYLFSSVNANIKYDEAVNMVRVEGAIENGYLYHSVVKNENPKSPMNIYMTEPNMLHISDGNLLSDDLCATRAKYEMIKQGRLTMDLTFTSVFIPHLEVNKLIWWNNKKFHSLNTKYIINSISFNDSMFMNMNVSNIEELNV